MIRTYLCLLVCLARYLVIVNSHHLDCLNKTSEWDCQDYRRLLGHYGANLETGLLCMGYNKFYPPHAATRNSSGMTEVQVGLKFTHINNLQDDIQVRDWKSLNMCLLHHHAVHRYLSQSSGLSGYGTSPGSSFLRNAGSTRNSPPQSTTTTSRITCGCLLWTCLGLLRFTGGELSGKHCY